MKIQLQTTNQQYYLIVNRDELHQRAAELGYDNVILYTGIRFRDKDLEQFKAVGKSVFLLFYDQDGDDVLTEITFQLLDDNILAYSENLYGKCFGSFRRRIRTLRSAVRRFPKMRDTEELLLREGIILSSDYDNRCGNCHRLFLPKARYCVFCGTPRGEGRFEPYENTVQILYGPPIRMAYHCYNCGKEWDVTTIGRENSDYCPRCGMVSKRISQEYIDWEDF